MPHVCHVTCVWPNLLKCEGEARLGRLSGGEAGEGLLLLINKGCGAGAGVGAAHGIGVAMAGLVVAGGGAGARHRLHAGC